MMQVLRSTAAALAVFLIATYLSVSAQTSVEKGTPTTGTGRIAGQVADATTGAALRRVRVTLTGLPGRPVSTVTDRNGAFVFGQLPPGRFRVSATRTGFIPTFAGQVQHGEPPPLIQLKAGESYDGANIALRRGGVITGRIVDESGDPVVEARVQAYRTEYVQGLRRLISVRGAETDDRGQFRIHGLQQGRYYLSALIPTRVELEANTARPSVEWNAGGDSFAPTFYPGAAVASDAQQVVVTAGVETPVPQFGLLPTRLSRISGTVVDSRSKPASAFVVILANARSDGALLSSENVAEVDAGGRFTLSNATPGEYRLDVRAKSVLEAIAQTGGGIGQSQAADAPEFASVPITVGGEDVDGLVVVTGKGYRMSGSILADGSDVLPEALRQSLVQVSPLVGVGISGLLLNAAAPPRADGSFEVKGLIGRRLIRMLRLPPEWTLQSVKSGSYDITDSGIDLDRDLSDIVIAVTSKPASVSVHVVDERGTPVATGAVVIFPKDSGKWALPMNRYVVGARISGGGQLPAQQLPAGDYLAAPVEALEPGEWAEPAALERLAGRATAFSLAAGESKSLRLVIGSEPR